MDYANVKPEIVISGIDPDGDVEAQVRVGLETASYALGEIDGQLDISLSQILSPVSGQPGFRDQVTENSALLKKVRSALRATQKRLEALEEPTAKAVRENAESDSDDS